MSIPRPRRSRPRRRADAANSSSSAVARKSAIRTACGPCSAPCRPRRADATWPRRTSALDVVLATGGARGITAEALRELAQPGNVAGPHRPLAARRRARRARRLRRRRGGARALHRPGAQRRLASSRPAEIGRKAAAVLAAREMRANIDDFRGAARRSSTTSSTSSTNARCANLIADIERATAPSTASSTAPASSRTSCSPTRRATAGRASSRPRCSACCSCSVI